MPDPKKYNEAELITLIRSGDDAAFRQLFDDLAKPLAFFGIKLTGNGPEAEDAVSTAFLQLWLNRQRMISYGAMQSYLYTLVYNRSMNYLKHEKVAASVHANLEVEGAVITDPDIEAQMMYAETMVAVYVAMDSLPAHHRDLIHQSYLNERSTKDIAAQQGKSMAHIRTARARAMAALREILKEKGLLEVASVCWSTWLLK